MSVTRTIELDDELDAWLRETAEARAEHPDAVAAALIAEARRARAEAELTALLEAAERSGVSEKSFEDIWDAGVERARSGTT